MRRVLLLSLLMVAVLAGQAYAQTVVRGKVTSAEDGTGIPGVNVLVKGTTEGTITNINGEYNLPVSGTDVTLVFRAVGFVTQEIALNGRTTVDVSLVTDTKELETVVVTGYREQDLRTTAGSVAKVGSSTIEQVPIASFDQILQGQAAGVLATSSSGQPGNSGTVIIRGIGSINGSSAPLYIMDGVQISAAQFGALNPNDIESINILKDASSTSIYGSRGANGVIVITTKTGKPGKAQINYNFQYGVSAFPELPMPMLNTNEKIDFELLTGGTILSTFSAEQIDSLRQFNTNWADEITRNDAVTLNHEVTASGGTDNTQYYISLSYFSQEGTVLNTFYDRYSGRFNFEHQAGNFRFGEKVTVGYTEGADTRENDQFIGSPLNAIRWSNPYEPVFEADGETFNQLLTGQPNGVQELTQNRRNFNELKIVASVFGAYDFPFLEGLTYRINLGGDFYISESDNFTDPRTNPGAQAVGGQGSLGRGTARQWRSVITNSLTYTPDLGVDHQLSVGLYQEYIRSVSNNFSFTGFGFQSPKLTNEAGITQNSADFIPEVGGGRTENGLISYFVDATYGFRDKYFLSLGARVDGSSRFGAGQRFASFGSVGFSWRAIEESFLQDVEFLSDLKLRASYGTVGNQGGIGNFAALEQVATTASYAGNPAWFISALANPDLTWEETAQFNVGIDFGLFGNRVSGSVDYYNNLTNRLFLGTQLSRSSGFASQSQNVGEMVNRGFEFVLNTVNVSTQGGFEWSTSANVTYNINEVLSLPGGDIIGGTQITREGEPLGTNYLVPYLGVNPANGDALYLTAEGEVTNVYDPDDRRTFGTRFAPWFGGFTNTFRYKGFSASVFFSWVAGNDVFNNDRNNVVNPAFVPDQLAAEVLDAWKQPGDITDVPRIATVDGLTTNPYFSGTSRLLENGSFLRLRNALIAYQFPQSIVDRVQLRSLRVFVQGQNLLTFTEFQGFDPEISSGFLGGAQYPAVRTVTAGVNVGF